MSNRIETLDDLRVHEAQLEQAIAEARRMQSRLRRLGEQLSACKKAIAQKTLVADAKALSAAGK